MVQNMAQTCTVIICKECIGLYGHYETNWYVTRIDFEVLLMVQKSKQPPGMWNFSVIHGIFTISTCAGFLPSTVFLA